MTDAARAPDVSDHRVGTIVQGRYRIVRKIGEGGMGAVYEGEHILIKRRVAIKCLHAHFATNADVVARFYNEAMAANAIQHPNIVEVTDLGHFDDGAVFMVLELLEGRDLAALITEERALTVGSLVHVVLQTCDALGAAHAAGIVHRDLKPENLFLVQRGSDPHFVKLLDFGIAKFREGALHSATRTGTAIGTPYYMSPEQAQGIRGVDHRADIYSLGVLMFHALTGRHPFDDESYPMLIVKIVTAPPPSLADLRADLPAAIVELVARMLAKNPADRPASCDEVKGALEGLRVVTDAPILLPRGDGPPSGGSGIRPSPPSWRPVLWAGGILAGAVGLTAIVWVIRTSPEPDAPRTPIDTNLTADASLGPVDAQVTAATDTDTDTDTDTASSIRGDDDDARTAPERAEPHRRPRASTPTAMVETAESAPDATSETVPPLSNPERETEATHMGGFIDLRGLTTMN